MSRPAPAIAAVYLIRCEPTGDSYVGGSSNLVRRTRAHRKALAGRRHSNVQLQALYDQHGPDAFSFVILERVEQPQFGNLNGRERFWREKLRPTLDTMLARTGKPKGPNLKSRETWARKRLAGATR